MNLEKLKILVETKSGEFKEEIEALFNPNQISIQKSSVWRRVPKAESDTPKSQFRHGEPATLTLELFFDTYEAKSPVTDYTRRIYHLTTVEKHGHLHRPPLCQLQWGEFDFGGFQWVLQSLNQRFTLFMSDGTPVRATVTCTFKQWRGDRDEARLLNKQSADVAKTWTVRRGDTLSSIAGEEYRNPALWRPIAEANGIDNPRLLTPGQTLAIPALRSRNGARR